MALHIRDDRAAKLAKELADRRDVSMTQAVIEALQGAFARDARPLPERLQEIAREAERLSDPARRRRPHEQEIDDLWGNP